MKIVAGGIAVIDGDTHISKWVKDTGRLDHDQWALERILPHIPAGGVVIDGGAFIGDHTVAYLRAVGPQGRVLAFEPNSAAFECLAHNCPNAECFWAALSYQSGWKCDLATDKNAGASHLVESQTGVICTQSIDGLSLERLDFLKLDVEGYEFQALMGGKETILRCRPTMWIEVNRGALERQGVSEEILLNLVTETLRYSIEAFPEPGEQYDILCKPLP